MLCEEMKNHVVASLQQAQGALRPVNPSISATFNYLL